jgi:hypothetical protein
MEVLMANDRKAAIDDEGLEERPLSSLSAAEFLAALSDKGTLGIHTMRFWSEKKKYELYVEPENLGKVTFGNIFRGVQEKKKVELEKDPRPEFGPKLPGAEFERFNPEDLVTNPSFREAVTTVAREVVRQLGTNVRW